MKKATLFFVLAAALGVTASEVAYWRAARSTPAPFTGSCIVLALGCPTKADGAPSSVQRFRVEAAVEAYREHQCTKLVLSGGAVRNQYVEAESMASLAEGFGVRAPDLVLERSARSTWENIGCSAPLTRAADRVLLVSDSLHAQRAARYACRQDSGLCERFIPAGIHPPVELLWWSLPAAANELRAFIRDFLLYQRSSAENAPTCGVEQ